MGQIKITEPLPYLAHEVGDDPVEGGSFVAKALLSGAEGAEVLGSLGHHVITELKRTQIVQI